MKPNQALSNIVDVISKVLQNTWKPLSILLIEILIITTVLYCICNFIPHDITAIKGLSFLTFFVTVISVRLLLFKSNVADDFEEQPNNQNENNDGSTEVTVDTDDILMPVIQRQILDGGRPELPQPGNIKSIYPFTPKMSEEDLQEGSTRG